MSDVFISYSRGDRARIERLSAALEATGLSAWWDREISGGTRFAGEIESRLAAAKVVVVAWSRDSVSSMWVLDEASVARDAGKLVPISLDGAPAPIGFRQIHVIDFSKWRGEREAPEIDELVAAIARITAEPPATAPAKRRGRFLWRRHAVAIAAALTLLALAGAFTVLLTARSPPEDARVENRRMPRETYASIAVLPFNDLSEGAQKSPLADALADEIINTLGRNTSLRVVARTSSFVFKDKAATAEQIGRTLDADAILEGSLTRAGQRLKVSLQLIDTQSGFSLWSDLFDRTVADIFDLEEDIAARVAARLNIALRPSKTRVTNNLEAYQAFAEGKGLMLRRNANVQAMDTLKRAVALDPKLAEAYADMSRLTYWLSTGDGSPPDLPGMKSLLDKAAAIKPDAPETILARNLYLRASGDYGSDLKEAERGAALYPNDAEIAAYLGRTLQHHRDSAGALKAAERAAALDPMSEDAAVFYAQALYFAGRRTEFLRSTSATLNRFPDSRLASNLLFGFRIAFGDPAGALAMAAKALASDLSDEDGRRRIAYTLATFGFTDESHALLKGDAMDLLRLDAMNPARIAAAVAYEKTHMQEIPADIRRNLAYATEDLAAFLPELEREASEPALSGMLNAPDGGVFALSDLAFARAQGGQADRAEKAAEDGEKLIAELRAKGRDNPHFWLAAALLASFRGDQVAALERLERMLAFKAVDQFWADDPGFASVREDPRYREFVKKYRVEFDRQRKEIIASGVLKEIARVAARPG
jgi:TolB-like protein/tetratricopeptide (TPR) repeat protein